MFSNNSPVDRTTWQKLTSPIQTESLKDNGALAQDSTILVNSDAFFRSYVGIGSLILARRSFLGWGNKPISNEMQRILNKDNTALLPYGSALTYDNRFLSTAAPDALGAGVFHVGMIALNFDLISTLRVSQPPAWESVWTGINSMKVISGRVNGAKRAFSFSYNILTSKIELYEFLQETTTSYQDNDSIPILWIFETPVLFNKDIKPLTTLIQLENGEFYISNVQGAVKIKVFYRPDFYPCWTLWREQDICVDPTGQYAQPGYRMRLGLGEPSEAPAESGNDRPLRIGNFFQFRVEITGSCTWHGLKVEADEFPQPTFALVDTPSACQAIDCQVPDDLRLYSLQGFPPIVPPVVPHIYPFFNQEVFFDGLCSGGNTPSFTGSMPGWISLDAPNNRLVGKAGVIGGDTQEQANANAQLALNQFAQAAIADGSLSCASSLTILRDDELPSYGAVLDGHCDHLEPIGSTLYYCSNFGDIFSSTDGLHWTNLTNTGDSIYDVAFSGSRYVAGTDPVAGNSKIYTSTDGISWSVATAIAGVNESATSVVWGNSRFVLGLDLGYIFTSPDGVTWTNRGQLAGLTEVYRLRFLNSIFYAVCTNDQVYQSSDGASWSVMNAFDNHAQDMAFGNGIYMVCSNDGASGHIYTSPDTIVWTTQAFTSRFNALAFGNGQFVVVDQFGKTWYSPDGVTWTDSGRTASSTLRGAAFFGGRFVVSEDP
jgi:hypothetical protein